MLLEASGRLDEKPAGSVHYAVSWTLARRAAAVVGFALPVLTASAQPSVSNVTVYLTLGSDYITHGLSQTNGGTALRVAADYAHASGFIAGAWISNVEYATERQRSTPREYVFESYVGLSGDLDRWSWTVMLNRYGYPRNDYDYTTISGSVGWRGRLVYAVSYTDSLYSRGSSALGQEITGYVPLLRDFEISATVGSYATDAAGVERYAYGNIGLSKSIRRFSVDLRWHDAEYEEVTPFGRPAQNLWVLSVSAGFRPD
jgi:uncharacterized protein (TIGR02001 family)